jgi:hypothetical protein
MANTKVTGDVIANGTISTVHLADDAITAAKLDSTATGITFADLTVDTNTLYVDATNNRVGIGTTLPTQALHVVGNIYSVSSGTDGGQIRLANSGGGSNWYWAARTTGLNLGELGAADGRMFIANGGNVGIGTINPQENLHIADASDGVPVFRLEGGSRTYQQFVSDTKFYIRDVTASSNRIVLDSSGNVGIGTSSPDTLLHIYNPDTNWGAYSVITLGTDVEGTNQAQLKYYRGASASTESFQLSVRGTTALTALYNGNVGIGTDTPSHLLTLEKTDTNSVQLVIDNFNTSDAGTETSTIRFRHYRSYVAGLNDAGEITIGKEEAWDTAGARNSYMSFGTRTGASGVTEKMRIDSSGNVSIGTDTPLYVYSEQDVAQVAVNRVSSNGIIIDTSRSAAYINLYASNGGSSITFHTANANNINPTQRMSISSSGDVLISTNGKFLQGKRNSGSAIIDMIGFGAGTDTLQIKGGTSGGANAISFYDTGGFLGTFYNSNFGIGATSPGEKLTIGDTGNVGMSITDGTHTQYVASIATANAYANGSTAGQLYLRGYDGIGFSGNQGGATHITLLTGGNVGIAETAPAAKLQVSGDRDGNSEYVAVLGEDGGANGAANSANTTPVHKTLLTGYSIPYNGQTNARLTSVGFLEFDSTPGWTGNQRNWALTSGYDMGGTNGPKFAILMGNTQNVEPQLGTNGGVGTGTGDGVNTRVAAYWKNTGDMVVPEGGLFVKGRITGDTDNANNNVNYLRTISIPYSGSTGSFTFDIDPVAEFGTRVSGGRMKLEVSGWGQRLSAGYIVYRNDGTGSGKIGTGDVIYYRYAWSESSSSSTVAIISVSLVSSSTNVIRISFSGWHSNDHGFEARLTATS